MSDCSFSKRLESRVMTTAEWIARHRPHVSGGQEFAREPFPHPSGEWFWLVCTCGAKHLTEGLTLDESFAASQVDD